MVKKIHTRVVQVCLQPFWRKSLSDVRRSLKSRKKFTKKG